LPQFFQSIQIINGVRALARTNYSFEKRQKELAKKKKKEEKKLRKQEKQLSADGEDKEETTGREDEQQ